MAHWGSRPTTSSGRSQDRSCRDEAADVARPVSTSTIAWRMPYRRDQPSPASLLLLLLLLLPASTLAPGAAVESSGMRIFTARR